jgi:hypothetical protein
MALVTDKFIHLHIPKNAGGSINRIITRHNKNLGPPGFEKGFGGHFMALGDFEDTEKYKFFVVRNPWDYYVSHWEFGKQKNQGDIFKSKAMSLSFPDFVNWLCVTPPDHGQMTKNWRKIPNAGYQSQFYHNFSYRAENSQKDPNVHAFCFEEGLEKIFEQIGKDTNTNITFENIHTRPTVRKPYREYYKDNDGLVELVRKYEQVIVDEFGYEF